MLLSFFLSHNRIPFPSHAQTLRLYPVPDLLVIADRCESYKLEYEVRWAAVWAAFCTCERGSVALW